MLGYELMKAYPNISCFSTTRHGGCSEGNYASFNCTGYCGDEAEHVQKNREILCELLPQKPLELIIPHQTHSTNIGVIDDACIRANKENRLEDIDAIITELPAIAFVFQRPTASRCCFMTRQSRSLPLLMPVGGVRWERLWQKLLQ